MAIVESMWLKNSRKRLGNTVVYQAMGQTRQRELATHVTNPRTNSQMTQRVKWANLVAFYRANRSWMKYAFETKKSNQSEYNKLMSLNVASSSIYLPKHVAAGGGCVVQEYIVTQGSLPSIECLEVTGGWDTNIVLGNDYDITSGSTVAVFSQQVIQNNPAIRQGDQISFIRLSQQINGISGVPYVVVREYELIIDTTNEDYLSDYLPLDYIDTNGSSTDCRLKVKDSGAAGGFVLILSRTISGKTYVSTQRVVVANNETLINAYSSPSALQAAIDSYGTEEDAFLSSTTANRDNQPPTMLSILSLRNDDEDKTVAAGQRFTLEDIQGEDMFTFYFNANVSGSPITAKIVTNKGDVNLPNPNAVANAVEGTVPEGFSDLLEVVIMYGTVTIAGVPYRIDFEVRNGDVITGLE